MYGCSIRRHELYDTLYHRRFKRYSGPRNVLLSFLGVAMDKPKYGDYIDHQELLEAIVEALEELGFTLYYEDTMKEEKFGSGVAAKVFKRKLKFIRQEGGK